MGTMPKEAPVFMGKRKGVSFSLSSEFGSVVRELTERNDVLRSDYQDDRRARVARVGFGGEVRGGDDADYEAELLESPACLTS